MGRVATFFVACLFAGTALAAEPKTSWKDELTR